VGRVEERTQQDQPAAVLTLPKASQNVCGTTTGSELSEGRLRQFYVAGAVVIIGGHGLVSRRPFVSVRTARRSGAAQVGTGTFDLAKYYLDRLGELAASIRPQIAEAVTGQGDQLGRGRSMGRNQCELSVDGASPRAELGRMYLYG
jgi:hypothetical protein